jgi:hypothetical protein
MRMKRSVDQPSFFWFAAIHNPRALYKYGIGLEDGGRLNEHLFDRAFAPPITSRKPLTVSDRSGATTRVHAGLVLSYIAACLPVVAKPATMQEMKYGTRAII